MHMEMEEKYEKQVMKDQREKYKRMKELMDEKKPMTFEDLN